MGSEVPLQKSHTHSSSSAVWPCKGLGNVEPATLDGADCYSRA